MADGQTKSEHWQSILQSRTPEEIELGRKIEAYREENDYREAGSPYNLAALAVMKPNLKEEPDGK